VVAVLGRIANCVAGEVTKIHEEFTWRGRGRRTFLQRCLSACEAVGGGLCADRRRRGEGEPEVRGAGSELSVLLSVREGGSWPKERVRTEKWR